jgi:hypothetical protein
MIDLEFKSIKAGHDRESITADVRSLIDVIRRIDGYDGSKETIAPRGSS